MDFSITLKKIQIIFPSSSVIVFTCMSLIWNIQLKEIHLIKLFAGYTLHFYQHSSRYDNLTYGANTSINPFFYGTYLAATKASEPSE